MKRIVLTIVLLLLLSCNNNVADKPEKLVSEDQMVDIYYDLAVLQAIRTFRPEDLSSNNIEPTKYIYKKYKIDSLTFVQNNNYYASNLEQFEDMQRRVTERLNEQKKLFRTVKDSINDPALEIPGVRAKRDSARQAALDKRLRLKK